MTRERERKTKCIHIGIGDKNFQFLFQSVARGDHNKFYF